MSQLVENRWRIKSDLGEGGQAWAHLVEDTQDPDRAPYALKRLKNLSRLDRFRTELEAVTRMKHQNVLSVVDSSLDCNRPFIVTEYCAGGSLAEASSERWSDPTQTLRLFIEVCSGVMHAHEKDILHRDLKPDNIFLRGPDGPAVVGDFGLCLLHDQDERHTQTMEAVGARWYMAPELEDGRLEDVTAAVDIYSLGKILFWMFSGNVFSREKHREPQHDLRKKAHGSEIGWDKPLMEHINLILDRTILEDPFKRMSISELIEAATEAQRKIANRYHVIAKNSPLPCLICGDGKYLAQRGDKKSPMGLNMFTGFDWRVFACSTCGHAQYFRADLASNKKLWNEIE